MSKIRFGLIGSGWRAEFYIRIAKALPEMFDLAAVMIRSKEKGEAFSAKFGVKVVNTLDELVEKEPEFVVMAIKRGIVTENLITFHLPDQCRDGTHASRRRCGSTAAALGCLSEISAKSAGGRTVFPAAALCILVQGNL